MAVRDMKNNCLRVGGIRNESGQLSFEALVSFIVMLSIISASLTILLAQGSAATGAASALKAKAAAEKCALLADAIYSNSGSAISGIGEGCFASGAHEVRSEEGGKVKTAATVAEKISNINYGGKNYLEVEAGRHYG